jgi:hypothetical protein
MMEKVGMKVNGSKPASTYSTGKIEEDVRYFMVFF